VTASGSARTVTSSRCRCSDLLTAAPGQALAVSAGGSCPSPGLGVRGCSHMNGRTRGGGVGHSRAAAIGRLLAPPAGGACSSPRLPFRGHSRLSGRDRAPAPGRWPWIRSGSEARRSAGTQRCPHVPIRAMRYAWASPPPQRARYFCAGSRRSSPRARAQASARCVHFTDAAVRPSRQRMLASRPEHRRG
jgi:hypothetical protein